jgi:carbon monoxide dehydrogenase subunit G
MTMAEVLVTEDLPVPAAKVWELVRDFGGVQKWLGGMVQSLELEGEGIGAIRTITLPGDTKLHEQLKALDEEERSFSYAIVRKSPLPMTDDLAKFKLVETGPDSCRVEWGSTFEPAGMPEHDTKTLVEGIYTSGIAGLKQTLGL